MKEKDNVPASRCTISRQVHDGDNSIASFSLARNDFMNEAIKAGEAFKLTELVPYAEGRIANMDVFHQDSLLQANRKSGMIKKTVQARKGTNHGTNHSCHGEGAFED